MKILIDTNVLIDYILKREPYTESAEKILFLCKNRKIDGCIAAHSVMNMFYILRKEMTVNEIRLFIVSLSKVTDIIGVDKPKIFRAIVNENFKDFEDCVQMECAKEFCADYIVTRNIKDFQNSVIKPILPDEFLMRIKE